MYRMIFRYRWAALLFVLLTVGGAIRLVGTGEGDGQLEQMQRNLAEQREQLDRTTAGDAEPVALDVAEVVEAEPGDSFSDDAELVDNAEGFDPSPDAPEETEGEETDKPVRLVESSSEAI